MAADTRSYSAGHFLLSLDGEPAVLKKAEGGNIKGEVVTIQLATDNLPMKHISTLKFEPFKVEIGMSMGANLYEWIKASMQKAHIRKNGYVVSADYDYKAQQYRHFSDALITEIGFPALDGTSKDSAHFNLSFQPTSIAYAPGDKADIKGVVSTKQKKWLSSNFKVEIGDLPCKRVTKVDAFTIKQGIVEDAVGEFRTNELVASKIEMPNLKLTISAADIDPWMKWFDEFVIKGKNGQEMEKNGSIQYLDPSGQEVLGTVNLFQCGIFSLQLESAESNKDSVARFNVELYVERFELELKYV